MTGHEWTDIPHAWLRRHDTLNVWYTDELKGFPEYDDGNRVIHVERVYYGVRYHCQYIVSHHLLTDLLALKDFLDYVIQDMTGQMDHIIGHKDPRDHPRWTDYEPPA